MSAPDTINLEDVAKEVNGMSEQELKDAVLKVRVRQKVQQKKNQGSEKHKEYQLKQRERQKALVAKAKELGIYDDINKEAEAKADARLKELAEEEAADEGAEEETTTGSRR